MRRWHAPTLAILLAAMISIGSTSESVKLALHTHGTLHPWIHLLAFALVGFAAMLCTRRAWLRLLLVVALLLLAWGTEYREHLLDGWPIEAGDVQQDDVGVLIGTSVGWLASWRRRDTSNT